MTSAGDSTGSTDVLQMIPQHERRILEAHVRGVSLSRLALATEPLNEYELKDLKELIRQRMRGFPLQYIIGNQAFYGREFYINTSVLIPRPETEGLVENVLKRLPARSNERLLGLDFGTGSGCIALTLALERPDLWLTAVDASQEALDVCNENGIRFKAGNIDFLKTSEEPQHSEFETLGPFDFIVSNPPYLAESDEIADDVRQHEPQQALFCVSDDPLFFYRFLVELMQKRLAPGGFGAFEIAHNRAAETAALFDQAGFSVEILKDLPGKERYLIVKTRA